MASTSNALFASTRRERSFGLVVAAAVLAALTLGGSGALFGAYTGSLAQNRVVSVRVAS